MLNQQMKTSHGVTKQLPSPAEESPVCSVLAMVSTNLSALLSSAVFAVIVSTHNS